MEEKTVSLSFDIFEEFTNDLADRFLQWTLDIESLNIQCEEQGEELPELIINISSHGGEIVTMRKMLGALDCLPNVKIVRAYGFCDSAALFFFLESTPIRMAAKYTTLVYHNIIWGVSQSPLYEHEEILSESKKIQEEIDNMIVNNSKITKKQLKAKRKEDWQISLDEAIKLGVVTYNIKTGEKYTEEEEDGK